MLKLGTGLRYRLWQWKTQRIDKARSSFNPEYDPKLTFTEAAARYSSRPALYNYMHHYYCHVLPPEIRAHREFFSKETRAYGEDAFHAMWWMLFREFKPALVLEIGVFRGQTLSLWALIAKLQGLACEIHGISPFDGMGDSVSVYPEGIDYLGDTLAFHKQFGVAEPVLVKALSTDQVALDHIASRQWDLIYIDGGHDEDVVLSDYRHCRAALKPGGILVLDDAALYAPGKPVAFSFAGHPGPSKVVRDVILKDMTLLGFMGHNAVFRN